MEGSPVTSDSTHASSEHVPAPGEITFPKLETDQNVAPRPEEEIADVLRAEPDVADHSEHSE